MKKISKKMASAYLVVKQFDNGEYKLELSPRLPGGGAAGWWAGAWAGKIGVHLGAQIIICTVATGAGLVTGGAGFLPVYASLTTATAPAVEAASVTAALAGGIAGGAATGPI